MQLLEWLMSLYEALGLIPSAREEGVAVPTCNSSPHEGEAEGSV